jgi:hypothetical protein
MESNNLLIGHNQGKEIFLIERFVAGVYGRELSHCLQVHAVLDLMWARKEKILGVLHFKM